MSVFILYCWEIGHRFFPQQVIIIIVLRYIKPELYSVFLNIINFLNV
jgi:hypothetical protein